MVPVWRPLAPRELDHERLWLAVAGAGLFCLALTTIGVVPVQLPQCTLKLLTGLPCPTCGMTRAVMALTRFDLPAAFLFNPLVVFAVAAAAVYLAYAAVVTLLRLPRLRPRFSPHEARLARGAAIGLVMINWAYLVLAGR